MIPKWICAKFLVQARVILFSNSSLSSNISRRYLRIPSLYLKTLYIYCFPPSWWKGGGYQRELDASSTKASLYPIILGWRMEARIRTSFRAFSFSFSDRFISFTFFRAYSVSSLTRFTLYTLLYAPSPVIFPKWLYYYWVSPSKFASHQISKNIQKISMWIQEKHNQNVISIYKSSR